MGKIDKVGRKKPKSLSQGSLGNCPATYLQGYVILAMLFISSAHETEHSLWYSETPGSSKKTFLLSPPHDT